LCNLFSTTLYNVCRGDQVLHGRQSRKFININFAHDKHINGGKTYTRQKYIFEFQSCLTPSCCMLDLNPCLWRGTQRS